MVEALGLERVVVIAKVSGVSLMLRNVWYFTSGLVPLVYVRHSTHPGSGLWKLGCRLYELETPSSTI